MHLCGAVAELCSGLWLQELLLQVVCRLRAGLVSLDKAARRTWPALPTIPQPESQLSRSCPFRLRRVQACLPVAACVHSYLVVQLLGPPSSLRLIVPGVQAQVLFPDP